MALRCLIPALLVLLACTSAGAFQANISPSRVNQGDAFAIRIHGVNASEPPSAFLDGSRIPFTPCGEDCFIGVGAVAIDAKPGAHKIQLRTGEERRYIKLLVRHTRFPTKALRLPDEKVFLSEEDTERANREEEKLRLLWQRETARLWEGDFILPLENRVSTAFGEKRVLNRRKTSVHQGVDIKGREGEEVRAANSGKVVLAEELFFGGNTVIIDHGQGIYTIYMHLSAFNVKCGDTVSRGDSIGEVGSTGRSTGPHLHFGVKIIQVSTNPLSLVRLKLQADSLNLIP